MKFKNKNKPCSIKVNDVFDELRDENNRLCNENKRINELLDS